MINFFKTKNGQEQLLEPLLRFMRIKKIRPLLAQSPNCILLDIGCGWEARFLKDVEPLIARGIGIDPKAPDIQHPKISTITCHLEDSLPFNDSTFDVVTMLAVLEHLDHAKAVTAEIHRVLRPGGFLCGTVPSLLAKPVLEFLAYKLNIVNPDEIRDHKKYYYRQSIYNLMTDSGFVALQHNYFQLGMNNFFVAKKGTGSCLGYF